MSIDIAITHFYQTALRKADRDTSIHKGDSDPALADERIDTPAEADAALTNILTGMEISKAPQFYQALLRKEVDRKEGVKRTDPSHAFNDTIDADEVAWAKQVLLAGRTRQEVLSAFVFYTPEIPQGFLSCEAPKQIFSIPYISTASIKKGRYGEAAVRLAKFFFDHDGDPPNAIHSFKVYDKEMIAAYGAYHVYEDDATHIGNGGAGTSEGQVLFFNFMTLYAALSGDKRGMEGAYNYIRYFMMPHDGKSSRQLPDYMLGSKDPRWNPYLIHWLIDISGVTNSGNASFGPNVTYEFYEEDKVPKPRLPQADTDLDPELKAQGEKITPDIFGTIKGSKHTFRFGAALDADQWYQNGLMWASMFRLNNYSQDTLCFRGSLIRGLSSGGKYPQVEQFAYYWGGNIIEQNLWGGTTPDLYTGYQDPAAWVIMGEPEVSRNVVKFLKDAQQEFGKRYGETGPFMPVYLNGEFGWKGVDPNTDWMGFQYRTFGHLAQYYYLTGDKEAKVVLDNFYAWIQKHWTEGKKGEISIPTWLVKGEGTVRLTGYTPNHHGLLAQGLVLMAAKSGDKKYQAAAQKLLDDAVNNRQASDGSFPDTELVDGFGRHFAFRQAEMGIALSLYDILLNKQ